MLDVPCSALVSSAVSGWELLPGVFALNHRILMPHHGRSGSVKRATKPESESETETEAETVMETETETQTETGTETETETETNQKVSHLSADDSVYPYGCLSYTQNFT